MNGLERETHKIRCAIDNLCKTHNRAHLKQEIHGQQTPFPCLEHSPHRSAVIGDEEAFLRHHAAVYPFEEAEISSCWSLISSVQLPLSPKEKENNHPVEQ